MDAAEATGVAASSGIGPVVLDALVIGAGQAGLAAGYHLRRASLSFAILEAGEEPGGSWPSYYESLTLFSPSRYSGLPGMPFPGPPDRRPVFPRFTQEGVAWDDGEEEAVDAVVIATGYRPNLDYLRPLGALREDGRPYQRAGIARSVPGLYFVGLPFQTSFSSATLRGVGPDAALVVSHARRFVARGTPATVESTVPDEFAKRPRTGRSSRPAEVP